MGTLVSSYGQLNSYKYIIVPKRFAIFKEDNLHQTSVLIKQLFTQQGFNTIYDDNLPDDLANQRCLGAVVDLEDNSSLLRTKFVILLKDCNSTIIFRSPEGSSRSKDYKKAYHEAIREAFVVFKGIEYQYSTVKDEEESVTVSFEDDVKSVEEVKEESIPAESTVVLVATPEEQYYKDRRPDSTTYVKGEISSSDGEDTPVSGDEDDILVAKEVENGFELIDSEEKVHLTLFNTSSVDVFLAKTGQGDGMVYKKDSKWFFEYYEGSELMVRELNIKFQ